MLTTVEVHYEGKSKLITIAHPICRIGSNPNLELCVQGIDSHAATLRMQQGKRMIYNRSPKPLRVGKKSALPDQTVEWLDGEELQLNNLVTMRLGTTNLKRQTESVNADAINLPGNLSSHLPANPPSRDTKRQRNLLLAAFFLVFGTIVFSSDSGISNEGMSQQLEQLINKLQAAELQPQAGVYREIRFQLQNAVLRSDRRESATQELLVLTSSIASKKPELRQELLAFVKAFLQ